MTFMLTNEQIYFGIIEAEQNNYWKDTNMYKIMAYKGRQPRKTFTGPLAETLAILKAEGFIILNYWKI